LRPRIALIGVGNPWRGDDGVGRAVVQAAGVVLGPDVEVVEVDGEPSRLIDAWTHADLAVVVDALRSGAVPGTIRVWHDALELARGAPPTGSHSLGLANAIALGAALDRFPRRLIVVGVEVAETASGQGLSPAVATAVDDVVAVIVAAVQAGSKATSSAGE
jgi:hydrogenase maturation protease